MKRGEREGIRTDIREAFDFARFLIAHPDMLKKVRNGSHIQIIPAGAKVAERPRLPRRVQAFAAERVFRSV